MSKTGPKTERRVLKPETALALMGLEYEPYEWEWAFVAQGMRDRYDPRLVYLLSAYYQYIALLEVGYASVLRGAFPDITDEQIEEYKEDVPPAFCLEAKEALGEFFQDACTVALAVHDFDFFAQAGEIAKSCVKRGFAAPTSHETAIQFYAMFHAAHCKDPTAPVLRSLMDWGAWDTPPPKDKLGTLRALMKRRELPLKDARESPTRHRK